MNGQSASLDTRRSQLIATSKPLCRRSVLLWITFVLILCSSLAADDSLTDTLQSNRLNLGGHEISPKTQRYSKSFVNYQLPNVRLVDINGKETSLLSVLDHEGFIFLQFISTTCPTTCPILCTTFSVAQEKLRSELDEIRMISISIDPANDTPRTLQEFAQRLNAGPQWHFLSGSLEAINTVQIAFDVYEENITGHKPVTFFRESPGQSWVRFDGLMSVNDLLDEYNKITRK